MKLSFSEIVLFIVIFFLIFLVYDTKKDLNYASDTVNIQNEAILKQQKLIDFQIYYINSLRINQPQPFNYNEPI